MPVKKLPRPDNVFLFSKRWLSSHATQCAKSCFLNKVIDTVLDIDSIDQQFFHSERFVTVRMT